jgi:hypothetical protein
MHAGASRTLAMAMAVGAGLGLLIACNRMFGVVPPPPEPRSPYLVNCPPTDGGTDGGVAVRPVELLVDSGSPDVRGTSFELLSFSKQHKGPQLVSYGEAHGLLWGKLVSDDNGTGIQAVPGLVANKDLGELVFAIAPSPGDGDAAVWFAVHCDVRSQCYLQRYEYRTDHVEPTLLAIESSGASSSAPRYVLTSAAPPAGGGMLLHVTRSPRCERPGSTSTNSAYEFCWSANEAFQADATHLRCECIEISAPVKGPSTVTSTCVSEVLPLDGPPMAILEGSDVDRILALSATSASELHFENVDCKDGIHAASLRALFPDETVGVAAVEKDKLVFATRDCIGVAELGTIDAGRPEQAACAFKRDRPILALGFLAPYVYWVESESDIDTARRDDGDRWTAPEVFRVTLDDLERFGSNAPDTHARLCANRVYRLDEMTAGQVSLSTFRFTMGPAASERLLYLSGGKALLELGN